MLDRLHDSFDRIVMYAVALWLLFITLPSLDEEIENADGSTTYPTRGTPGSCYKTRDGQHYVRLPTGHRKIGKILGAKLIARSKRVRRKAIARRVVLVVTLLIIAGSLVALLGGRQTPLHIS